MNTEQERKRFEEKFPVPWGVKYSELFGAYIGGNEHAIHTAYIREKYQFRWEAWQARAAESSCTQSELDELYEILNGTPHMEQVTPEVFKLALTRHMTEFVRLYTSQPEQSAEANLREKLSAALDYIAKSPCDPDITSEQIAAWNRMHELGLVIYGAPEETDEN